LIAKKQATPLLIELKPSKKLQQLVAIIHLIAIGASIANALPVALKAGLVVLIGLNFKFTYPKLNNEQPKIKYSEKAGWEISNGGDFEAVEILKSTVITTFIIFLQVKNQPALLVANDALSEDDYRQLIVKLRMTAH
jgi:hypothetical protein